MDPHGKEQPEDLENLTVMFKRWEKKKSTGRLVNHKWGKKSSNMVIRTTMHRMSLNHTNHRKKKKSHVTCGICII